MPTENPSPANDPLGDPAIRRALTDFVRRRVPSADVDDVVQTVLVEALASPGRPRDAAELKRWLLGVARHKVVDHHRRSMREPPTELPDLEAGPPPLEARSLAQWAEEQAGNSGDAQKTLAWMAREGEGEKLEAIAAEEKVPAARVRQRVSRMRRWMKERWTAELAAVAMLAALAIAAWWLLRREAPTTDKGPEVSPTIAPEPPSPMDRARVLRAEALKDCDRGAWQPCLDGLDAARGLDPEGDRAPEIGAARDRAADGLRAVPSASATASPSAAPSGTIAPTAPAVKGEFEKSAPGPKAPAKPMFDGKKESSIDYPQAPSDGTPSTGKPATKLRKGGGGKAVKKVIDSELL